MHPRKAYATNILLFDKKSYIPAKNKNKYLLFLNY